MCFLWGNAGAYDNVIQHWHGILESTTQFIVSTTSSFIRLSQYSLSYQVLDVSVGCILRTMVDFVPFRRIEFSLEAIQEHIEHLALTGIKSYRTMLIPKLSLTNYILRLLQGICQSLPSNFPLSIFTSAKLLLKQALSQVMWVQSSCCQIYIVASLIIDSFGANIKHFIGLCKFCGDYSHYSPHFCGE